MSKVVRCNGCTTDISVHSNSPPTYCAECFKKARTIARRKWQTSPQGKYRGQMDMAKNRFIPWLFDFTSWLAWWGEDYTKRGTHKDELCMARRNDVGPYSPDNCYKLTNSENTIEQLRIRYELAKIHRKS